jgi:hypothetical protein
MSTYPRSILVIFEHNGAVLDNVCEAKKYERPGMAQNPSLPFLKNILRTGQN